VLGILRVHHGHAQAAALQGQREREVIAHLLGLEQRDRLGRHRLQLRFLREREVERVRQGLPQRAQVEQTQLDQVGPQAAAVDELRLQPLIELRLRDEALADQMRSELLFSHAGPILDRSATGSAGVSAPGVRQPTHLPGCSGS
jgi:hypothetical protein